MFILQTVKFLIPFLPFHISSSYPRKITHIFLLCKCACWQMLHFPILPRFSSYIYFHHSTKDRESEFFGRMEEEFEIDNCLTRISNWFSSLFHMYQYLFDSTSCIDSATFGISIPIPHQYRMSLISRCRHHHQFLCILSSWYFPFFQSNLSQSFSLCFNNCVIVVDDGMEKEKGNGEWKAEIIFHSQIIICAIDFLRLSRLSTTFHHHLQPFNPRIDNLLVKW